MAPPQSPPSGPPVPVETTTATIAYVLLLGQIVIGVLGLVAVIMAYVHYRRDGSWLDSHYAYQITTFWLSLLYGVTVMALFVGGGLTIAFAGDGFDGGGFPENPPAMGFVLIGLGVLAGFVALVWLIVRCAKGLSALNRYEPIADPDGWGF